MPYRYFYSTEESDTALKAILDAYSTDYVKRDGLMKGVSEYKIWIEKDNEFLSLGEKIELQGIRASASPEKLNQFGNILPSDYFDTTKYAGGCTHRDTDTLAHMISFLQCFPIGTLIAQRDLDIYGSASLGTIALTLSSLYKKTYNVSVNGTVGDRTLIRAVIDATAPTVTQTNATCNQAMFDFVLSGRVLAQSREIGGFFGLSPTDDLTYVNDYKASQTHSVEFRNDNNQIGWVIYDFGQTLTKSIRTIYDMDSSAGGNVVLYISTDQSSWTEIDNLGTGNGTYKTNIQTNKTFRYVKYYITPTAGVNWIKIWFREILVI